MTDPARATTVIPFANAGVVPTIASLPTTGLSSSLTFSANVACETVGATASPASSASSRTIWRSPSQTPSSETRIDTSFGSRSPSSQVTIVSSQTYVPDVAVVAAAFKRTFADTLPEIPPPRRTLTVTSPAVASEMVASAFSKPRTGACGETAAVRS